jgi:O-antigen/teichoic acid export membrane protein
LFRWGPLLGTGITDALLVIFSFVSGVLIARLLGPAGRGQFAVVVLWPSVLAAIGSLGLRDALTYEQARGMEDPRRIAGTGVIIALLQSAVLMLIGLALIPLLTRAQESSVTLAALIYLFFIPCNLIAQYALGQLQGALKLAHFNMVRLTVSIVYIVAVLILWLLGSVTVMSLTLSLLFANLCTALAGLMLSYRRFGLSFRLQRPLTQQLFRYGMRNHLGSISQLLNQRADQMLMAVVLSPQELGWYAIGVSLSGLAGTASTAFGTLAFPKVAGSEADGQRDVTRRYSRFNVTVTLALTIVLLVLIPFALPLVYGEAYRPSVLPAEILTVGAMFVGMGVVWSGSLRGLGRPFVAAKAELLSLLVTVVGLAVLLRPLGIVGAAITSLVAYFASALYLLLNLKGALSLRLMELLRPISPAFALSYIRSRRLPATDEGGQV